MALKKNKADRLATAHQWVEEAGSMSGGAVAFPKGVNIWDPKEDKAYNVTIVPYEVTDNMTKFREQRASEGQLYYERSYYCHRGIGPEGAKRSYVCTSKTFGKKCAVCDWLNEISSPDDDKETKEAIKKMWAKTRQLWNVYVHDQPEKGVQLWDISFYLFGESLQEKLKKAEPEKRERYMRFHDPDNGYDFRLEPKEESMGKNKFLDFTGIEFKKRKEPISSKLLKKAVDLDGLIEIPSYKEIQKAINAAPPEDELEGSDEDEEEDEEVDSEIDDEDEEEEKPKKKSKPAKKKKPDPDEEDDDEQEEEEDDGDDEEEESEDEDDGDEEEDEDDSDSDDEDDEGDDNSDADDDDDGDEEDDGEDAPLKKGENVSFMKAGKRKIGKLTSINYKNGKALVEVSWRDKPIVKEIEDLLRAGPVKSKKKAPPDLDDEDDEDDEPLPRPKKKTRGK